jgi:hypothetical protein
MAVAATASRQLKSRSGFCITVSTDELNAFLTLTSSEENAQGVSEAELVEELKQAGVVFGLLDEELRNLAENQVFDKKILVARGKPPHMGKDAQIEYRTVASIIRTSSISRMLPQEKYLRRRLRSPRALRGNRFSALTSRHSRAATSPLGKVQIPLFPRMGLNSGPT